MRTDKKQHAKLRPHQLHWNDAVPVMGKLVCQVAFVSLICRQKCTQKQKPRHARMHTYAGKVHWKDLPSVASAIKLLSNIQINIYSANHSCQSQNNEAYAARKRILCCLQSLTNCWCPARSRSSGDWPVSPLATTIAHACTSHKQHTTFAPGQTSFVAANSIRALEIPKKQRTKHRSMFDHTYVAEEQTQLRLEPK